MRLPNGEKAIVDIRKLTEYCLNPDDPRGRHKARVFASALGVMVSNADEMRKKLFDIAKTSASQNRFKARKTQRDEASRCSHVRVPKIFRVAYAVIYSGVG